MVLLDTNILLRYSESGHAQHNVAAQATRILRKNLRKMVIVPQNAYEFWVVATRPVDVNGLGFTVAEAELHLDHLMQLFPLLRDERTILRYWRELVVQYEVKGLKAHDARLVAAMRRHGVSELLTFNESDFRRYGSITVRTPHDVVAASI